MTWAAIPLAGPPVLGQTPGPWSLAPDPRFAAIVVAAYLVASVPAAYVAGRRLQGIDVREYGTGNPGAANVWRNVGRAAGAGVALACFGQGLWPVIAARALGYPPLLAGLAGCAAIAGYAWPAFLRFQGGRAVAVSLGVLAGLSPAPVAALLPLFGLGFLLGRYALSMLVGFGALPIYLWLAGEPPEMVELAAGIYLFLLGRRLSGIRGDLRTHPVARQVIFQRLLHDRQPGQLLVGPRAEAAPDARQKPGATTRLPRLHEP